MPSTKFIPSPARARSRERALSRARELADTAYGNGWNARVSEAVDSGGDPFVCLEAIVPGTRTRVAVTWHTRNSGGYRLASCLIPGPRGPKDASLTEAVAVLSRPLKKAPSPAAA